MIEREQLVAQSTFDFAKDALSGYDDVLDWLESFTGKLHETQLTKNYVAAGYEDSEGKGGECGSDLIVRDYVFEFFVFAQTSTWGQNIAGAIRKAIEQAGRIPIKDYGQAGTPVIDYLLLDEANQPKSQRVPIADPEPWEQHVWLCTVALRDEYYAALS